MNQKWIALEKYQKMKVTYEKEYFKLGGDYAWFDGDKLVKKSVNQIREFFKNKKLTRQITDPETGETKTIEKSFYNIWSEDPDMREYTEVIHTFDATKVLPHQFNIFTGFNVEKIQRDVNVDVTKEIEILNEHLASLCNYNNEHVKLLKWFIAGMFKDPTTLPPICLVFISKEGVGKDMLYELIEMMINERSTFNVDQLDKVVGKFNSVLGGKLFGVINETDPKDSAERRDNIKFLITAKKVEIEGKHKDPVKTINCCRLMFFANRLCAFPAEDKARRPYIFHSSEKHLSQNIGAKANKEHFDRLANIIRNPQVQRAFYDELMKINTANFNFREIEKSELHSALIDAVKPPLAEFLSALCYLNKSDTFAIETTELIQLYNQYMAKHNMKFECSMKSLSVDLNFIYKVEKFPSNGKYKFRFHRKLICDILKKEFNIIVDGDETSMFKPKEDIKEEEPKVEDKAVMIRVDDHKKIVDIKDKEIEELKQKLKSLEIEKGDLIAKYEVVLMPWKDNEIKEAKQTIEYYTKLSCERERKNCKNEWMQTKFNYMTKDLDYFFEERREKKPTKKPTSKETDFVEIADGVILNKATNQELVKETIEDENDDFFN